jgi:nucleotide-binding universal stress UspA family protein
VKTILLVVDPSSSQAPAALLARDMASDEGDRVVALRTIPLEFLGHRGGLIPRVDPHAASLELDSAVDSLLQCGVRAEGMIRTTMSNVAGEIASVAAEVHADMIVMGSAPSLSKAIGIGAVRSWRVSRAAPCPVVVAQSCWVGKRQATKGLAWPRDLRQGV